MILSMTGYGEVQRSEDGVSYGLELRSLNNRYFKASIRLPDHLSVFEPEVERILRDRLVRGTVTYTLHVRDTRASAAQEVNVAALQNYLDQLATLKAMASLRVDLAQMMLLPGVLQPQKISEAEHGRLWSVVESVTYEGLDRLMEMRRAEGRALREDLIRQCASIREHLQAVRARAPVVLQEYHQRLLSRTNELLENGRLELKLDDLKREVALYAERCDINEEVSRLSSHLDQFERFCDSTEAAGRKLDFLAQETLREANTIGSKSNDAEIAHHVVEIKGAIDRLKEQVQNVV